MARKSLAQERTTQILDAFERCVVRHGIAGTSLESIAEEADVRRSILRHYVGNREALVQAMATRVVERHTRQFRAMLATLPQKNQPQQLVRRLLGSPSTVTQHDVLVIEALLSAAAENKKIRLLLKEWMEDLLNQISKLLKKEYGQATSASCYDVAYGLLSIWFNYDSLIFLAPSNRHLKAARYSALRLIESLE